MIDGETLLSLNAPLLRPSLAAFALGVSKSTIYRWYHEGRLPGVEIFGNIRIHRQAVARLLVQERAGLTTSS